MRTLLIGIDAACDRVLDPLFEAGELPTLRSLIDVGVSGQLESSIPPWTPSAWTSIYTGVNPGMHGIFGFLAFDGYDWDIVDATNRREYTLWELLDREGRSSVIVNAPISHPPRAFDGALIPGYAAPEQPEFHPPELLAEVEEHVGEYRIYPNTSSDYERLVQMRGDAFRYLVDRVDPDFGFVQFQQTDTVFHEQPGDWDCVRSVYRAVDEQIAAILDDGDPDAVLIVSDHGIGEYTGYGFRVNEFLAEHGYVEVTRGGGMPSWVPIRENRLRHARDPSRPTEDTAWHTLSSIVTVATAAGVTPERIGRALDRLGLREPVERLVPEALVTAGSRHVDFPASTAYARARIELGVRINLVGREPDGIVPSDAYETVRDEVIELLSDVTTPDGEEVFETVDRREAFFDGPAVEEAVDIVTIPADYDHFVTTRLHGARFGEPGQPWNHKPQGVVIATGDPFDDAVRLEGATVFDIAPTVLSTFGIAAPDRMDGSPLPFVEDQGTTAYPPYEPAERSSQTTDDIAARLETLGYVE